MTSSRPSSQYGIGILLKHLQHSLTWALSPTHGSWHHSPGRPLLKGSRLDGTLSRKREPVGRGFCKVLSSSGQAPEREKHTRPD